MTSNPLDALPPEVQRLAERGLASHGFDRDGNVVNELREAKLAERLEHPEIGLNALAQEIHMNALRHNWWGPQRTFGDNCALITSEVSEALEEYRDHHPVDETYYTVPEGGTKAVEPHGIPIELADVVIRVLDACAWYGINIEEAMRIKMDYNRNRPLKHGGKLL